MVELTQQTLSTSLIASWIAMVIAMIIQLYVIYLNWKQSKVKDQMSELISVTKEVRDLLRKRK
ncbi:hypothetical protein HYU11_02165 [Candidatus Woesearchaeota archaeon]|nr:hypothetical protein [Candidatus Woesearchaeota archaeon]